MPNLPQRPARDANAESGFEPRPGDLALFRTHGHDIPVRLGARDPRSKCGRGFVAERLSDHHLIRVPSPGNLRPMPPSGEGREVRRG